MKKGFDNEKYLATQSRCIRERIDKFGDKLYLEFGGSYLMTTTLPVYCRDLSRIPSFSF